MSTTTTTAPPTTCPTCQQPVNPAAFQQLRQGGPYILTAGACSRCEAELRRRRTERQRAMALLHYRDTIPPNYRPITDGGTTDISHPDWKLRKGGLQLAHLNGWELSRLPWACLIGPAGHLKSRVLGLHARSLALEGLPLLWINGAALGRESDHRRDPSKRTQANDHLRAYRTHPGVLILDDLWKGELNPTYIAALYLLLEHRNAHRLPILWSANTHPHAIATRIDQDNREPIIGRLIENSHLLDLSA
jgi:hypothetical protein